MSLINHCDVHNQAYQQTIGGSVYHGAIYQGAVYQYVTKTSRADRRANTNVLVNI
jgi:hypothetical protein